MPPFLKHSMARIKLGALISDIRGKIGGQVFQMSRGGLIIRNQPKPVNRRTNAQNKARLITGQLQHEWAKLSETDRICWTTYSMFLNNGRAVRSRLASSGFGSFMQVNHSRLMYSHSLITTPVLQSNVTPETTAQLKLIGGVLSLLFNRPLVAANEFFTCYMSGPAPLTQTNLTSRLRQVNVDTVDGASQNITASYLAAFKILPTLENNVGLKGDIISLGGLYATNYSSARSNRPTV